MADDIGQDANGLASGRALGIYALIEREIEAEDPGGIRSPLRILRELGNNALAHNSRRAADVLHSGPNGVNRENHRANQLEKHLKALLFALHARPLHGGPHWSLEEAIENANKLLDKKFRRD